MIQRFLVLKQLIISSLLLSYSSGLNYCPYLFIYLFIFIDFILGVGERGLFETGGMQLYRHGSYNL